MSWASDKIGDSILSANTTSKETFPNISPKPLAAPVSQPIPCPTCRAPIFTRENDSIVAHYNGEGYRCSASETLYTNAAKEVAAPLPEPQVRTHFTGTNMSDFTYAEVSLSPLLEIASEANSEAFSPDCNCQGMLQQEGIRHGTQLCGFAPSPVPLGEGAKIFDEQAEGDGWPQGWCSSCDHMTSRGCVISGRPACDKCGDWLIFSGVHMPALASNAVPHCPLCIGGIGDHLSPTLEHPEPVRTMRELVEVPYDGEGGPLQIERVQAVPIQDDCCRTPHCGGECTCEICAPDLAIRDLKAEVETLKEKLEQLNDAPRDECRRCGGTGVIERQELSPGGHPMNVSDDCPVCTNEAVPVGEGDLPPIEPNADDAAAIYRWTQEFPNESSQYWAVALRCRIRERQLLQSNQREQEAVKNRDQWERNSAAENKRAGDALVELRNVKAELARLRSQEGAQPVKSDLERIQGSYSSGEQRYVAPGGEGTKG